MCDEKLYGCDSCKEDYDRVTDCPVCYEIEDNKPIITSFCQSCCEEHISQGFCQGECMEDFVLNWQKEVLYLICKDNGFKDNFKDIEHMYIDNTHSMIISHGSNKISDVMNKLKHEDFYYPDGSYKGDQDFLIKKGDNTKVFDLGLVNKMEQIFSLFEDEHLITYWNYYTNGELLMFNGYNIWGIIVPILGEESIIYEQNKFNEIIREGLKFFKVEDISSLDWSILNDKDFENLCCDLLSSLERFENVKRTGGASGELGRDIRAIEKIETFFEIERRNWLVQCKHFHSRKVSKSDFDDLINLVSSHKSDGIFIISSGELTPSAKKILSYINDDPKYPFRTAYWERNDIEKILVEKQDILKRYFFS